MLLAGDIGGTKTNLAVYPPGFPPGEPLVEKTFPSARYPNLESLVKEFLSQVDLKVDRAAFGVAGPVLRGRVRTTNLPWEIDQEHLREVLNLSSICLLNDLEAIAQSVPLLKGRDLRILNRGKPVEGGAIALIAPGTGLGEAFLTWDGSRYLAHPSEGGHVGFAPTNRLEIDLLRYLRDRYQFEHVSYERVCSGLGLPTIYAFLKDRGQAEEPAWLAERLAAAEDRTPVIVNAALGKWGTCELCVATLDTFVSILGAEAGNLALKVLATGGVYLGGGIPPRILPILKNGRFMDAFVRKGRMSSLLTNIPVRVILNSKAALLGAACRGLEIQP
ncbi:MAG: glucokinase [Deltaproteobacteria bacterium]|nr:glucokinase [Deltaproteobacteria bacterium]